MGEKGKDREVNRYVVREYEKQSVKKCQKES